MTMLYQCDFSNGSSRTRAYIEEKAAKVGCKVQLKDSEDPDVFWTVDSVPNIGIKDKYLAELKTAYRKQREASDI